MWRNGVMSFASVAVLMSLLVVIGGFTLLVYNIDINLEDLGDLNQIAVFCNKDATEAEVAAIGEKINKLDNIDSVEFVSKAEGLQWLKEKDEIYKDVSEADNPLPDKYVIKYIDTAKVPELDYQLSQIDGISKVNDRLDFATTIENMKSGVMLVLFWFLIILGVVSIFIIINTIKLSVFSRKNEISIMRYVGATGWFISLPFIFEGIIIGLISSVIAYFLEWYAYSYVHGLIYTDLQMVTIVPFSAIRGWLLLVFVGAGILTGIIGSCISLGKYLKD